MVLFVGCICSGGFLVERVVLNANPWSGELPRGTDTSTLTVVEREAPLESQRVEEEKKKSVSLDTEPSQKHQLKEEEDEEVLVRFRFLKRNSTKNDKMILSVWF